jgi:hypothetical protein
MILAVIELGPKKNDTAKKIDISYYFLKNSFELNLGNRSLLSRVKWIIFWDKILSWWPSKLKLRVTQLSKQRYSLFALTFIFKLNQKNEIFSSSAYYYLYDLWMKWTDPWRNLSYNKSRKRRIRKVISFIPKKKNDPCPESFHFNSLKNFNFSPYLKKYPVTFKTNNQNSNNQDSFVWRYIHFLGLPSKLFQSTKPEPYR